MSRVSSNRMDVIRATLLLFWLLASCTGRALVLPEPTERSAPCSRPSDYLTNPPQQLSELCLLENQNGNIAPLTPDVIPYELNTPLFSDYALKTRLLWIPAGTSIEYAPADA